MQGADGPVAMMEAATRLLGEHLGVAQVGFAEVDADQARLRVDRDWVAGPIGSVVGRWHMSDFGEQMVIGMKAGQTIVIDDVMLDERSSGPVASASYAALGARSVMVVPLVRAGVLNATLFIHDSEPRAWHCDEVALVEDTASRLWGAVLRARAEIDIETRSRELEALIGTAPIGFAYFDREHRYLRINDELAAINGLAVAKHIGVSIDDLMPVNAAAVSPILDEVFATGKVAKTIEVTGETPLLPGVERHWLTSWFPVFGDDGEVVSVGAWVVEITERRRAEDAQRASEAQLRQAQALGGIGSWEWNHATGEGSVSDSYRTMHGLAAGDVMNSDDLFGIMHPDDRAAFDDAVARGLATGKRITVDYRVTLRSGEPRNIRGVGQRVGTGAPPITAGIVEDVTERLTVEKQLADSEARLRAVVDSAPIGLVFADAQGTIIGGNARVEEIIGHPVLPSPNVDAYGEWVSSHPDGRQVEAREYPLARVVTGEAERDELEVLYRRGDGRDAWIRFIAASVRNANGVLIGGVVASLDIDREKRLTDELEREVERAVAERQMAMAQLHEAQKLETLGQLTGGVAHDFNNLLTPIVGVLEMMEQRVASEERTSRLVPGALQSAERAKNLVQRLLAFARRQHLETRPVDLETLIEGMRDLIDRSIGPTIHVEVALEPGLWAVKADPNQLELALLNLAVNARDAMPIGGTLRFAARHEEVQFGSNAELAAGGYVCLTVSDTGTGMDADTLRRCIEPFYTSKGVGEGTGLGLSMVHGMMRQLGGALLIASAPGQGTTMNLWLPCSEEAAEGGVVSQSLLTHAPRRSTILLVDDEELVRE